MALTVKYVTTGGTEPWATNSLANPSSITEAAANAASGDEVRIEDGTYTLAANLTFSAGAMAAPIYFVGYVSGFSKPSSTSRGSDGFLITTGRPTIENGGSFQVTQGNWTIFRGLDFTGTGNRPQVITGSYAGVVSCTMYATGTGGASMQGIDMNTGAHVVDCDVIMKSTSSDCAVIMAGLYCTLYGCLIQNTGGSGVEMNNSGLSVINNLIWDCDLGVDARGAAAHRYTFVGNTIVECGYGINFNNGLHDELVLIAENLITDCTSVGIRDEYASVIGGVYFNNRFDRNGVDASGLGDWPQIAGNTDGVTQADEFADPDGEDYSLAPTSPAIDAAAMSGRNLGHWQNAAAVGGGLLVHPGMTGNLNG